MARLKDTDRRTLLKPKPWAEPIAMRSPRVVQPTAEARGRYCRWATEAAKFYKGVKPVRFAGDHWKL